MLISVIIPLYNKEKSIYSTILSVLNQNYPNIEIIVVNDGSTDNSMQIVSKIKDPRINVISKENGGPSSARNIGVKSANGQWIYFLDADDQIETDCLTQFLKIVDDNPNIKVFVANYYIKKGNLFKKQSLFMKDGVLKNNFRSWFWGTLSPCQGAVLYDKNLLLRHPYPEIIRRWEDAAMFFQIMQYEKIFTISTPVFTYILDNSSASHARNNIKEDFLGYLDTNGKSFWERMCVYILYCQAIKLYPSESSKLYNRKLFNLSDIIAFKFFSVIKWMMRALSKGINILNRPNDKTII